MRCRGVVLDASRRRLCRNCVAVFAQACARLLSQDGVPQHQAHGRQRVAPLPAVNLLFQRGQKRRKRRRACQQGNQRLIGCGVQTQPAPRSRAVLSGSSRGVCGALPAHHTSQRRTKLVDHRGVFGFVAGRGVCDGFNALRQHFQPHRAQGFPQARARRSNALGVSSPIASVSRKATCKSSISARIATPIDGRAPPLRWGSARCRPIWDGSGRLSRPARRGQSGSP